MIRRILLIMTITGLVASIGVWIVSYCYWNGIEAYRQSPGEFGFVAIDGRFAIMHWMSVTDEVDAMIFETESGWKIEPIQDADTIIWMKFFSPAFAYSSNGNWWRLQFPVYVLVTPFTVLLGVLSIPWWRRLRRRRRGCCLACGYDLTGNVSGACPECGAAVAARDANSPRS